MTHIRANSNSLLARVIEGAIEEQDADLALNPCEVSATSCRLASGIETTFVALMAHWLVQRLQADGHMMSFQEIVYMPSRRAERQGGFDLSIGEFTSRTRVRTMHKVLYGRRGFNRWCDESWNWSIRNTGRGDWCHLKALLASYADERVFQPFLVLHLCFCVHEYRRIGKLVGNLRVPDLDSPLRTVVVDLGTVVDQLGDNDWHMLVEAEGFQLQIAKQAPEQKSREEPQEYLDRIAGRELFRACVTGGDSEVNLPILTLDQLYARVVQAVEG